MLKENNKLTIVIVLLNISAVLVALFFNKSIGYYMYGLSLLSSLLYFIKVSNPPQKTLSLIILIPVIVNFITSTFNFINFPLIVLSQSLSLILFIYLILKKFKISIKEISILLPVFANACISILNYFNY
jgi:hypothetical protein